VEAAEGLSKREKHDPRETKVDECGRKHRGERAHGRSAAADQPAARRKKRTLLVFGGLIGLIGTASNCFYLLSVEETNTVEYRICIRRPSKD
jgi:hypothetical protein